VRHRFLFVASLVTIAMITTATGQPAVAARAVISDIQASVITGFTATITWTTDLPTTSRVEYGGTTSYGLRSDVDARLVTSHSVTLSALAPATLYHYLVRGRDATNELSTSDDRTFMTAYVLPPVITHVQATLITGTAATITWTTNEPATSRVQFGLTIVYGFITTADPALATRHSVTLTGLIPATTYHYFARGRDAAGNVSGTIDQTFTTLDTIPPVISAVGVSAITATIATITWRTDEPASSRVEYGTTITYGLISTVDAQRVIVHSVTLTDLAPATTYHFFVRGRDAASNLSASGDFTFATAAPTGA